MKLIHNEEQFHCNKAVRGYDYIRCYDTSGIETRSDDFISDFRGYSLLTDDGNIAEFSSPEPANIDRLRALESALLTLMMGEQ